MKKLIKILLLSTICVFSQQNIQAQDLYNKWSIDASVGANKAMSPIAPGFSYSLASPLSLGLGARYMANSMFGVRFSVGYDGFTSEFTQTSTSRKTNLFSGSIEAVANIGRIANFEGWSKHIGLLVHGGPRIGSLNPEGGGMDFKADDMNGGIVIGISPIFKIGSRLSITTDLSIIGNIKQDRSFEFIQTTEFLPRKTTGFDGYYTTASIGLTLYLGKNKNHIDWKFNDGDALKKRLEALEAELENTKGDLELLQSDIKSIETKMMDDDNDGVANYLDIEPNTPEGMTVNTKGQTVKAPSLSDLIDKQGNAAQGLFYTVQLGVFSNIIPEQYWKGITPLYTLKIEDGTTRYFSGVFHSVDEARPKLLKAKENGLVDAFITAYYKGKRITVAEADLILSTRGEEVLRPKP